MKNANMLLVSVEMMKISDEHDGVLNPHDVFNAAKSEKNILHNFFTWDKDEAAYQWNIEEARRLIRMVVTYEPRVRQEVPVFVSLREDRSREGGYRTLVSVMSDSDLRRKFLHDALVDLEIFEAKYKLLKELEGVMGSISDFKKTMYESASTTDISKTHRKNVGSVVNV